MSTYDWSDPHNKNDLSDEQCIECRRPMSTCICGEGTLYRCDVIQSFYVLNDQASNSYLESMAGWICDKLRAGCDPIQINQIAVNRYNALNSPFNKDIMEAISNTLLSVIN